MFTDPKAFSGIAVGDAQDRAGERGRCNRQ